MVTFDLWETLLFEGDGADSRRTLARCMNLANVFGRLGVNISVEQLSSVLEAMTPWFKEVWDLNRDVTLVDQLRFIVQKASNGSLQMRDEWIGELSAAYVSPLFDAPPYLNPDALRVLRWLRDRDKRIGLICNTGRTPGFGLRRFLRQKDIADFFDVMLFSDETGIRKPDAEIFKMALETLGVKPFEAVHVGDNLETDISGAKNAGLRGIHLSTEAGRDMIAESNPTALASISRNPRNAIKKIVPDKTISSLGEVIEAIKSLENN